MNREFPYQALAYYSCQTIDHPHEEVARHKKYLSELEVACRIYISEQGINGQMSASSEAAEQYIEWMRSREEFAHIHFKLTGAYEQLFPRKTVKYRKQLVAIDLPVDFTERGEYLSPEEWKEFLDTTPKENFRLIDVRNEYEWRVGHFVGSTLPQCNTFREFAQYVEELKASTDLETPILTACTGGIRCEFYTPILKKAGFKNVYQLHGGIIHYGQTVGNDHWLGKLFVFDDRMTVPLAEGATEVIGSCHHCQGAIESYYNCANMDCNELFLCCHGCLRGFDGCCSHGVLLDWMVLRDIAVTPDPAVSA